ncbi:MAG: metallophosphoesterase family protein [Bacteroidia bacterium]
MKKILLISDSHFYTDQQLLDRAMQADELWHAGDWGDLTLSEQLTEKVKIRGVYGNIDSHIIRKCYPKELFFEVEGLKVYMTHIGGYPGRYHKEIKQKLEKLKPDLYICGHSHILKIVRDKKLNLMHFNPGAIGNKGFHKKRTCIDFIIDNGTISDVKVLEYEKNYN